MNMRPQQPIMGPSIGARMLFQVDMESKLTEILAQMREIGAKMTYLEKRIAGIEEPKPKEAFVEIKAAAVHHSEHHGHESFHHRMERYADSLRHQLAKRVTTIAGLHEAVTHENRCFRSVWALLVVIGIGATFFCLAQTAGEFLDNPTATSVQLQDQDDHEFPPMLLCPEAWFDAAKALDLGMTIEMLKYALSYPDDPYRHQVPNISHVRDQFYRLYKEHKFKSLLDFYDAISPDFESAEEINSNRTYTIESTYNCPTCSSTGKLSKTMLDARLCHVVRFKPIEKGFGMYSGVRAIGTKYKSRTLGVVEDSPDWYLYFPTYYDCFISMYPKVTVRAFYHNWVRFNAQRFIALDKPEQPCHAAKDGSNYSSVTCMADCHNRMYKQRLNCNLLWLSNASAQLQPWDYCNFMDPLPPENWILSEFFASDGNSRIDAHAADVCVRQCPRECDRMIFETTLQLQASFTDAERKSWLEDRLDPNISAIDLFVKHGAVYQGGVMILREMRTYTFIQLINNIGGTLGLFVGGTIMTFAQLILVAIDYFCTKKTAATVQVTKVQELKKPTGTW